MAKRRVASEAGGDEAASARERIVAGAGRRFRSHGFGGAGVDALAQAAGVTSGAFYGQFRSKSEAFRAAVEAGLEELRVGVVQLQGADARTWGESFVDFYLGERRTCVAEQSCALQSLVLDVARADEPTRVAFEVGWTRVRDAVAAGLSGGDRAARRRRASSLLAVLVGGVSIARAVGHADTGRALATDLRPAALRLIDPRASSVPAVARPSDQSERERAVREEEDAWNRHDAPRLLAAFSPDATWRRRTERAVGEPQIRQLIERAWERELDARRIDELWMVQEHRCATRFVCEWRDDSGTWFRSVGHELLELDDQGRAASRASTINDAPIREDQRFLRWPSGSRPADHAGLAALEVGGFHG